MVLISILLWVMGYLGGFPSTLKKTANGEYVQCDSKEYDIVRKLHNEKGLQNNLYKLIKKYFHSDVELKCTSREKA